MTNKLPYWKCRSLQIAIDRDRKDQEYIQAMHREYDRLSDQIYKEIQGWVKRYADNDQISEDAAYELLSKKEQKTWRMSLEEFRRKAKAGGYTQELNQEYFRSRINRLEQLERQLYFELAEMANNQEEAMSAYLKDTLNETYLRQIYELTDQGSFPLSFDRYSSKALQIAISKPWMGNNFSKRVWGNHLDYLPKKLSKVMATSISQGWGVDRTVKEMMRGVDSNLRNRMTTLVQTESAHIAEVANEKSMEETGVEHWEWLATLESHTCDRCASYDGKTDEELLKEFGFIPNCPDHPNCRCTRVPVIPGWESKSRWQRDPITGKGSVSKHQSFEKWKEKNIDKIHETRSIEKESKVKFNKVKSEDLDKFIKQSGKISEREKKILYDGKDGYIGTPNSFKINRYLRNQESSISPESKRTIETLDKLINKNVLKTPVVTSRWADMDWLRDYATDRKREIGDLTTDNILSYFNSGKANFISSGFVSSSLVPTKNIFKRKRNVKMEIEVPKGAPVFVTENIRESEMILNKDSIYEIIGAEVKQLTSREILVVKMRWKG